MNALPAVRSSTALAIRNNSPGLLDTSLDSSMPLLLPGTRVQLFEAIYIALRTSTNGLAVLEHEFTREAKSLRPSELARAWREGNLRILVEMPCLPDHKLKFVDRPLSSFPDSTRKEIDRKLYYVERMAQALETGELASRSSDVVEEWLKTVPIPEGYEKHLSRGVVVKSYGLWLASGHRPSVLAHGNAGISRVSPLGELIQDIIFDVLETFLIPNKDFSLENAQAEIAEAIKRFIESGDLPADTTVPAVSTIASHKRKLDKYKVAYVQLGTHEAGKLFEPRGKLPVTNRPFAIWEVDHTLLPVTVGYEVKDPRGRVHRVKVGRVWLTAVIDVGTRMILAIVIGMDPPSTLRTMQAIRMAMEPKEHMFSSAVENPVTAAGIPIFIVTDNGADFHSKDLSSALMDLHVRQVFAGAYMPHHKPFVERFFRTLKFVLRKIPGAVEKKGQRKTAPRGKPRREPKPLTIDELVEWIWRWICDTYHQRRHAGLFWMSPAEAMKLGMAELVNAQKAGEPYPLRTVYDRTRTDLDAIFSIRKAVTLDKQKGLRFSNLQYQSGDLGRLASSTELTRIEIRVNPSDLGQVLVWHTVENHWFEVPCTMPEYAAGMDLWLHRRVLARIRQHEFGEAKITPPRGCTIDVKKYIRNEAELLKEVFQITGTAWHRKPRDLRSPAAHLGRRLDLAQAAQRLDYLDITQGRTPPAMGIVDLEKQPDGTFQYNPRKRKRKAGGSELHDPDADAAEIIDATISTDSTGQSDAINDQAIEDQPFDFTADPLRSDGA